MSSRRCLPAAWMRRRNDALGVLVRGFLLEHLAVADDGVQRRAELVGHVRQELRLVAAGRLELRVQAAELVVHAVHVRRQVAELVPVHDVDVPGEVARGDRGEVGVDLLDRPDHRPREDEPQHQGEDERREGHTEEEVPRAEV